MARSLLPTGALTRNPTSSGARWSRYSSPPSMTRRLPGRSYSSTPSYRYGSGVIYSSEFGTAGPMGSIGAIYRPAPRIRSGGGSSTGDALRGSTKKSSTIPASRDMWKSPAATWFTSYLTRRRTTSRGVRFFGHCTESSSRSARAGCGETSWPSGVRDSLGRTRRGRARPVTLGTM